MLELQLNPSEVSVYEKHSQNIYTRDLKKLLQNIIKASYTIYLSSIKMLHQLIKSLVQNIANDKIKVSFQSMINDIYSNASLIINGISSKHVLSWNAPNCACTTNFPVCVYVRKLESLRYNGLLSNSRYSNILSEGMVKIYHMQSIQNQWIRRIKKDKKIIPTYIWCKFL